MSGLGCDWSLPVSKSLPNSIYVMDAGRRQTKLLSQRQRTVLLTASAYLCLVSLSFQINMMDVARTKCALQLRNTELWNPPFLKQVVSKPGLFSGENVPHLSRFPAT